MKITRKLSLYTLCAMIFACQATQIKANRLIAAGHLAMTGGIVLLACKLGEFTKEASIKMDELTDEIAQLRTDTNEHMTDLNDNIAEFNANHLATNNTFNDPGMVGGMALVLVATSFIAYGVKSAADEQFFNNSWDPRKWQWYEKIDSGEEKFHNGVISMGVGGASLIAGITALAMRGAYLAGRAAQKV